MPAINKTSTAQCNKTLETSQALLTFPVAEKWFALPLESVRAVMTADLLRTLSGCLENLAGWLELQGQEVLVLDMTQTLVPGAQNASPQQIILLRAGDSLAGLITTGISETISVSAAEVEQTGDSAQRPGWAMGICHADGRTITVLNPEMLVSNLCPLS